MCIRIGIDWACKHTWRGWKVCEYALAKGLPAKDCPKVGPGGPPSPNTGSRKEAQLAGTFMMPMWCCSGQCCKTEIQARENKYFDERREFHRQFGKSAKDYSGDQSVRHKEYDLVKQVKTNYWRLINKHYDRCINCFISGFGMSNSMKIDMEEAPSNDVVPWPNRECLTGPQEQRLELDGILTHLDSYAAVIESRKSMKSSTKYSLKQYDAIRDYLLTTKMTSKRGWGPSSDPSQQRAAGRNENPTPGRSTNAQPGVQRQLSSGSDSSAVPDPDAPQAPGDTPIVTSRGTPGWEPQDVVPPIDYAALQMVQESDEGVFNEADEALTPFSEGAAMDGVPLPANRLRELDMFLNMIIAAQAKLHPWPEFSPEAKQFVYLRRRARCSRYGSEIESLASKVARQQQAQVPGEGPPEYFQSCMDKLAHVAGLLGNQLQELDDWFNEPEVQQQRQQITQFVGATITGPGGRYKGTYPAILPSEYRSRVG